MTKKKSQFADVTRRYDLRLERSHTETELQKAGNDPRRVGQWQQRLNYLQWVQEQATAIENRLDHLGYTEIRLLLVIDGPDLEFEFDAMKDSEYYRLDVFVGMEHGEQWATISAKDVHEDDFVPITKFCM